MSSPAEVAAAAQLFKVLGSDARLGLLVHLLEGATSVGALSESSGMAQPLVSQHLKTLRTAGLVVSSREGRHVLNEIADNHVVRVIRDALDHAQERRVSDRSDSQHERSHRARGARLNK